MKKKILWAFVATLCSSAVLAEDVIKNCESCHGPNGNSKGENRIPSIASYSVPYIIDTLKDFRSGERPSIKVKNAQGEETSMTEIARALSPEDEDKAAKYFSAQTFIVHKQGGDDALADAGRKVFNKRCEKCHEKGGNPEDDNGIILGQWKPYLKLQFTQFGDKTREAPKKMRKKFDKLSDEQKAGILEYLARGIL